jgi:hypothetical protein
LQLLKLLRLRLLMKRQLRTLRPRLRLRLHQ